VRAPPLLLVDVDGVISLFGFDPDRPPAGRYQLVDGIAHFLSATAGEYLRALETEYELMWCSGWEERANDYLPHALGLAGPLPFITFGATPRSTSAHWKLQTVSACVGEQRAVAWVDDAFDESCRDWASRRPGPTLLLATHPASGLRQGHVDELLAWAERQRRAGTADHSNEP
jgi:hypothetical protein